MDRAASRMKGGKSHRVPLTDEMLAILEPLKAMASDYVFEGQKRHQPLSNMSMLMLLRRMGRDGFTVHGFRSSFRDWAARTPMRRVNWPRPHWRIRLARMWSGPMRGRICWREGGN